MKTPEEQREYMRNYMREWKKKNPDSVKRSNRTRYLLKDHPVSIEDRNKYGAFLHSAFKIKQMLNEIKENKPELIKDVLAEFL